MSTEVLSILVLQVMILPQADMCFRVHVFYLW